MRKRAADARARGERPRPDDRRVRDRMVGVERIGVGVRDEHVGLELADRLDQDLEPVAVDVERVVAEVERLELGAERRARPARPRRGAPA